VRIPVFGFALNGGMRIYTPPAKARLYAEGAMGLVFFTRNYPENGTIMNMLNIILAYKNTCFWFFVAIYFSNTLFGKNIIVILAPYWTSVLFLIGIGLLGNRLFVNIPYHFTIYIILSIIFSAIHTYHGYLCYTQK